MDILAPHQIQPIIISGGVGRRLWPLSRAMYPKQFQRFGGDLTLFQLTAQRVAVEGFAPPLIICNEDHRFIVGEQLAEASIAPADIVLEPEGHGTAMAVAVAVAWARRHNPEAMLAFLPCDHMVDDAAGISKQLASIAEAADPSQIVLFGVLAENASPEYGYIEISDQPTSEAPVPVQSFREKPPADVAAQLLGSGQWLWNTGMVLARTPTVNAALEQLEPEILGAAEASMAQASKDMDYIRLAREPFCKAPKASFDHAVLEKANNLVVCRLQVVWHDVLNWRSLWRASPQDNQGNVTHGETIIRDTSNSLIMAGGHLVTTIGVDGLVIVVTDDTVLVAGLDQAGNVNELVDAVAVDGSDRHLFHTTVYRPWGSFHSLATGPRYQVKEIVVKPGGSISLQKHFHRAEHWIVVEGTAKIRRGDEEFVLHENESTYIPLGEIHRLENPGRIPVRLIEVQSGSYLGEDDIVRLEDTYGRN